MSQVILTQEQADLIVRAHDAVQLRDPQGNLLGTIKRDADFTDEDLEKAKQALASNQPRYTTQQVLEHLQSLENQ